MKRFIYKTTNLINGKFYIGQHSTENLDDGYMGSGTYLKKAFKKYGKENFKCEIIEIVNGSKDDLDNVEEFFIKHYIQKVGKKNMYNATEHASGCPKGHPAWNKGRSLSEEIRKKLSEVKKGRHRFEETKKKLSEANKGRHHSEESKKKISEVRKGIQFSEETKKKMSEAHSKKILCIETNVTYPSLSEAKRLTGVNIAGISNACNGKLKTAGGYHWKFV